MNSCNTSEDNCDGPVIGLGHSLGAILNFRARMKSQAVPADYYA